MMSFQLLWNIFYWVLLIGTFGSLGVFFIRVSFCEGDMKNEFVWRNVSVIVCFAVTLAVFVSFDQQIVTGETETMECILAHYTEGPVSYHEYLRYDEGTNQYRYCVTADLTASTPANTATAGLAVSLIGMTASPDSSDFITLSDQELAYTYPYVKIYSTEVKSRLRGKVLTHVVRQTFYLPDDAYAVSSTKEPQ